MPIIFVYHHINIRIYLNDHEPAHVHAQFKDTEIIVQLLEVESKIRIFYKPHPNRQPLPSGKMVELKKFMDKYKNEVLERWKDVFLYRKTVKTQHITRL